MKVLFCGCGSIGQRHIRNLRTLYGEGVEIWAWRTRYYPRESDAFIDDFNVTVFDDYGSALGQNPDVVFVTNPTSLHLETAKRAVRQGCHVFLEKPVAPNSKGVKDLESLARQKGSYIFVGYCMRYHPVLKLAKELISRGEIGRILYADAYFGFYLPRAHPWRDYKTIFRGKKKYGGGAALELSHEIDYLLWLLGEPRELSAYVGRIGDLEMNADDIFDVRMRMRKGALVHINTNFLQRPTVRTCRMVGEKGSIFLDIMNGEVRVYSGARGKTTVYNNLIRDINKLFLDELRDFMDGINKRRSPAITLAEGKKALLIIEAARKSFREKRTIKL